MNNVTQARKITQNERDYKETKSGMRHTARNYGNNSCGSHHKAKTRTFLDKKFSFLVALCNWRTNMNYVRFK
jgi:hypothetical protein